MNRKEITQRAESYISTSELPNRLNFDEKSAYISCVRELQVLVISCPALINYVGYLNIEKANQLKTQINTQATLVVKTITKQNRGSATEEEVNTQISGLRSLLQEQRRLVDAGISLYQDVQHWIAPLKYELAVEKSAPYTTTEDSEAISLLEGAVPTSLTGSSVTVSSALNIVSAGATAYLEFNGTRVPTSPLVLAGHSILGSLVKSSKNTATLSSSVFGSTTTVQFPTATYVLPVITNYLNPKQLVENIARSSIALDTSDEEVKTCLRVFKLLGVASTPEYVFQPLTFDAEVKKVYRLAQNICNKWKHPEIMGYFHSKGFNYVCSLYRHMSAYAELKNVAREVAVFTDTRGAVR